VRNPNSESPPAMEIALDAAPRLQIGLMTYRCPCLRCGNFANARVEIQPDVSSHRQLRASARGQQRASERYRAVPG
jgi:hypothetical protein